MRRIEAVVVSYNSRDFIEGCIESLRAQTRPPDRIWVVDNASTDGSVELLRRVSGISLIENRENVGFAEANNQAIRQIAGANVLCCNPDVVLDSEFLERASAAFELAPEIGSVTGKILRFDRKTIDSTGQFLSASRWARERGYNETDRGQYDQDDYVFSACGACALYRCEMVEAISEDGAFFDPRFHSFYEDLDLGWRAQRAGWRAYYVHVAVAYHYRGGSSGTGKFAFTRKNREVRFHILKNRYLTIMKNDTLGGYLLHLPFILARDAALFGHTLIKAPSLLPRVISYLLRNRQRRSRS